MNSFVNYNVRFAPGCPLDWWLCQIRADSLPSAASAHACSTGSDSFWIPSSHHCGTLVSWPARLSWHLTSATSIFSSSSEASCLSALSRRLTSILVADLVRYFGKRFWNPAMHARQVRPQVINLCIPLLCEVDAPQHCVKFYQVDVFILTHQSQPARIFSHGSIALNNDTSG